MKRSGILRRMIACIAALMLICLVFCAGESETEGIAELAEGAQVRVMSYNIMHPDWSKVPVNGRDETVAAVLRHYMADVVALQEAGAKWHKALMPLLADTGEYAFACRQSNAEGFTYNTTCFLYNPKTVKLVEEYILDLDFRDATRVLAVAVFEKLSDGRRFVVTNTHLAPREEARKYAKNMADLTSFAADTVKKYAGLPVIMAGDFNTPDGSEMLMDLMEQAGVRDAKFAAEVRLRDCATYFDSPDTFCSDNTDYCIDHIFVNAGADVKLFDIVSDHDVQFASDHTPIYADISFNN
ncbi:MAG: endonuclease/exonuclease/phosphatase family protein [Clostridiales bacterium]|nr:endonuclease/exonuclease/phosphatase family protein [Clostridiales bacterium]